MAESNFDSADILMNRGLNSGYGYGGRSGGYGNGHGNFPGDGSAINANTIANRDISLTKSVTGAASAAALSAQIATAAENGQSAQDRSDRSLSSQMSNQHDTLSRQIADNRLEDRFNALQSNINANDKALLAIINSNDKASVQRDFDQQRQLADCCCELKAGQATIIANQESHRLSALESENQMLRIRNEININNSERRGGNQGGGQGNG